MNLRASHGATTRPPDASPATRIPEREQVVRSRIQGGADGKTGPGDGTCYSGTISLTML